MPTGINTKENLIVVILLTFIIVGFNYPDIFLSKALYMDDNHRYILGLENKIHGTIYARNMLRAYVIFPLYKLLSINIIYARLAQTIIFYVPLAFLVYFLIRTNTKLPPLAAFSASVLPCILPGQTQIPSFIDGSYTVQGLLVFLLMLHLSFRFLKKENFSWLMLVSAFSAFVASIGMMDQTVFLVPVAVLMFLVVTPSNENWRRIVILTFPIVIMSAYKVIMMKYYPTVKSTVPIESSWPLFFDRLLLLPQYTFSFSHTISGKVIDWRFLFTAYIVLVSIGFMCADWREKVLICLGTLWVISSAVVFLTVTMSFSPRYLHITGFGISLVFVVSVWAILRRSRIEHHHIVFGVFFSALLLYSGFTRIQVANRVVVGFPNDYYESAEQLIATYPYPKDSQILLLNAPNHFAGGWWLYSSGFLKRMTGRADITGLVGGEKSYYDPFQPERRTFASVNNMNGIDLSGPIFIYRFTNDANRSLTQQRFALQWKGSSWKLYQFNLVQGTIDSTYQGNGLDEFHELLSQEGLFQDKISFAQGNPVQ